MLKNIYKKHFFHIYACKIEKSPYFCIVFFIVLDLRLTKVGARRCSFFYVYTSLFRCNECVMHEGNSS